MKPSGWIATSLFAVGACVAWAQDPAALVKTTFAEDAGGWIPIGQNSKIVIYHDPALGAPTTGALRLNYGVNKGEINALILPTPLGSLKTAKSIKLSVRADATTVLAIALQEEEGGRYVATFQVPKDKWQPIELSTGDFALAMEADAPKDPNGRLDMDLISGIFVADIAQLFALTDEAKGLFDVKAGPHTLYLDDFTIGTEVIPPSTSSAGEDVRIDSFVHPQPSWYGLGGVKISRVTGKPLDGVGLKAEYRQAPGKPVVLSRNMMPWVLTQSKSFSFDAASVNAVKLIVQVEETVGGKYNTIVDIPAGSEVKKVNVPFSSFKLSDDSKDADGKLDLGKVKTLLFIDATSTFDPTADRDNTLWINNIMGIAK